MTMLLFYRVLTPSQNEKIINYYTNFFNKKNTYLPPSKMVWRKNPMPRNLNYQDIIKESAESLLQTERQQIKAFLRDRIRFIRLLKSGECSSQKEAGKLIGISLRESQRVWKQYKEEGLNALLYYPYQGQPPRLNIRQMQHLKKAFTLNKFLYLHQVKDFIMQHYNVQYTVSGVYNILKRLKIKLKQGAHSTGKRKRE
jgi:transposase